MTRCGWPGRGLKRLKKVHFDIAPNLESRSLTLTLSRPTEGDSEWMSAVLWERVVRDTASGGL